MHTPSKPRRSRQKDFEGCLRCRARKVKCGKQTPGCDQCVIQGDECPGYAMTLRWIQTNQTKAGAQGSRSIPHQSWPKDWQFSTTKLAWTLVLLDTWESQGQDNSDEHRHGPFGVFRLAKPAGVSRTPPLSDSLRPSWFTENELWRYYIRQVAPQMMPYRQECNPWSTTYLRLANSSLALRDALCSQATAHMIHSSQTGRASMEQFFFYRSRALCVLQQCLEQDSIGDFERNLATMHSLIMSEVYLGSMQEWRAHLTGALTLLLGKLHQKPWLRSEAAWHITQSLCLIMLRVRLCDTAVQSGSLCRSTQLWDTIAYSAAIHPMFGFTVGISRRLSLYLIEASSLITKFISSCPSIHDYTRLESLKSRLLEIASPEAGINEYMCDSIAQIRRIHNQIFALGTLVCLLRETSKSKPCELLPYTTQVFALADQFRLIAHRRVSSAASIPEPTIWPLFYAAVELYRCVDQAVARNVWLDGALQRGIGNRRPIYSVIETVWMHRARLTIEQGHESAGEVIVDWKRIVAQMNIDLLLI